MSLGTLVFGSRLPATVQRIQIRLTQICIAKSARHGFPDLLSGRTFFALPAWPCGASRPFAGEYSSILNSVTYHEIHPDALWGFLDSMSVLTAADFRMSRPNVILIQVDQWRGDCLSIAGHPVVRTPYLDQLAEEGVRFTRAYSATPICIPARAALMTGLGQRSHGRVGYEDGVPWNYQVTLGGEFSRHGYQTHAIGKLHAFPERNPLGFQKVELHDGYLRYARRRARTADIGQVDDYISWLRQQTGRSDADDFETGLSCDSITARPWDKAERLHPTNWVVARALNFFAERDHQRPFLLYLSFHRPHPPFDPPAWAFEQYLHTPMPQPPVGDWIDYFTIYDQSARADAYRAIYPPDVAGRARAGYYGHMTHIDHQLNRLFEALHEWDLCDDTWVCFTSDHGEMLGDHYLYRKGYPYEGSARVPFILKGPSGSALRVGGVCGTLAEQRDVFPTLLECAGLPVPSGLEGRSLLPFARGAETGGRDYLHGEMVLLGQSMQWLTDGKMKYVWFSQDGHEQLFDLVNDPQECHDLARCHSKETETCLAFWRGRLITELSGCEEGFVQDGALVPGRPVKPTLSMLKAQGVEICPSDDGK